MYVDDMLIIGKKVQIQEFATKIQNEFSVKIQYNLTDGLRVSHEQSENKRMAWTTLYHQEFEQKFGDRAMKERLSLTL